MHDNTKDDASVATDLESGSRLPSTDSAPIPSTASLTSTAPSFQHSVLLPSPPCSPPSKPSEKGVEVPERSESQAIAITSGGARMLQAHSTFATAKLDISLLLKSSPSPPSSSGAEATRGNHSRASSVPPPTTQHFEPGTTLHRTSVSSSAASARIYQPPQSSTGSQLGFDNQRGPQTQSSHQQRPILPPLATSTLPVTAQAPLSQASSHVSGSSPQQLLPSPLRPPAKRPPPSSPHPAAPPAKRQSKWTPEEDALIIELRGSGMKWEEISKRLPGRSAISCRLHYQNYLERRSEWDEERKNRLARLYERLKPEMWGQLATELGIPWRAAEAMHWQLGEADMARRAGVVPFSLATATSSSSTPLSSSLPPSVMPSSMPLGPASRYIPGALDPGSVQVAAAPVLGVRHGEDVSGRPGRSSSFGPRLDEARVPRVEKGMSMLPPTTNQSHLTGQGLLPSVAEIERGLTAFDNRGRSADGPISRYGTKRHYPYPQD